MFNRLKAVLTITFLTIPLILLPGCGSNNSEVTSVTIGKKGNITSFICEDFSKEYYDAKEFEDMTLSEVSTYNSAYVNQKINLDKVEYDEETKTIKVSMTYEAALDYSHFNNVTLFYGTVQEALDNGYDLSMNLVDASGNAFNKDDLSNYLDKHVVITSEKCNIIVPYNIEFMTSGVTLSSKKEAVLSAVTSDIVGLLLSK